MAVRGLILQGQRLQVIRAAQERLSQVRINLSKLSTADIDDEIGKLQDLRTSIDQFVFQGDIDAFNLSKSITDIISELRRARLIAAMRSPKRKQVYEANRYTLRFLAEDELGNGERWPDLITANPGVRYSTDLIDIVVVNIP